MPGKSSRNHLPDPRDPDAAASRPLRSSRLSITSAPPGQRPAGQPDLDPAGTEPLIALDRPSRQAVAEAQFAVVSVEVPALEGGHASVEWDTRDAPERRQVRQLPGHGRPPLRFPVPGGGPATVSVPGCEAAVSHLADPSAVSLLTPGYPRRPPPGAPSIALGSGRPQCAR